MSSDTPTPGLRASDADREAIVSRLHRAATEGRLDADELEERVSAAYAAKFCGDLEGLVADVTPPQAARPVAATPVFVAPVRRTNGLAIASLATSLLWMWWLGSVVAIVFGHLALRQIAASGGRQGGRGFALAGLAVGYASILVAALVFLTGIGWT